MGMVVKELIEARWKVLIGGAIAIVGSVALAASYNLLKNTLPAGYAAQQVPAQVQQILGSFSFFVWSQWYSKNGPEVLAILAAVLGASLIASEVNKGTIFFLLSKPVSRDRVLLTKYLVSAAILLGILLLSGLGLLAVGAIEGHPQSVGGVLISTILLWLGTLFVLGVSLLFSIVFKDVLRPLMLALAITLLLSFTGFFPNARVSAWDLTLYWSDFSAYQGMIFPLKALIICLVAAMAPLAVAIPLFRKQAY
jgi:ABC-2 type transport system permease protein